jgi:hypothetical protein
MASNVSAGDFLDKSDVSLVSNSISWRPLRMSYVIRGVAQDSSETWAEVYTSANECSTGYGNLRSGQTSKPYKNGLFSKTTAVAFHRVSATGSQTADKIFQTLCLSTMDEIVAHEHAMTPEQDQEREDREASRQRELAALQRERTARIRADAARDEAFSPGIWASDPRPVKTTCQNDGWGMTRCTTR